MELDILFWIAIAAVYILQSIASRRRQPTGPAPEQGDVPSEELPSELQEALGEIGRVLRGESVEPQPGAPSLPEPHYEVETARESMLARLPQRQSASSPARTSAPSVFYDSLPKKAVFYDQAFEEQTSDTFSAPVITHDHDFSFQDPDGNPAPVAVTSTPNLKDHMVSRQSFIAAEVLAPPLSKRRGRR